MNIRLNIVNVIAVVDDDNAYSFRQSMHSYMKNLRFAGKISWKILDRCSDRNLVPDFLKHFDDVQTDIQVTFQNGKNADLFNSIKAMIKASFVDSPYVYVLDLNKELIKPIDMSLMIQLFNIDNTISCFKIEPEDGCLYGNTRYKLFSSVQRGGNLKEKIVGFCGHLFHRRFFTYTNIDNVRQQNNYMNLKQIDEMFDLAYRTCDTNSVLTLIPKFMIHGSSSYMRHIAKKIEQNNKKDDDRDRNVTSYDIVYIIGDGSKTNDELRYSLRSVQKNAIGLRKIFIVGSKPDYINDNVTFIPCKDIYPTDLENKDRNQWYKLEVACNDARVSENFLFGSDDFILTKPSRWQDFTPRHTGIANDKYMNGVELNKWTTTRKKTLLRFDKNHRYLWHPHIFTQIWKDKFRLAVKAADYKNRNDVIFHTFYYNFINQTPVKDFDSMEYHSPMEFKCDARHVSHWDKAFNYKPFREKISSLYKTPSKYESFDMKKCEYDISVIVPCFNSEKYLKECLDSILNNKFSGRFEIVCIDDGSTDSTNEILRSYVQKHKDIVLIENEKNMGLSYSRNVAIQKARGRFVSFVDSDDVITKDYLQTIFDGMDKFNCDIFYFQGNSFFDNDKIKKQFKRYENYYHTKPQFPSVLTGREGLLYTWEKGDNTFTACLNSYRRDFLIENNLEYITGILYEDIPFNIKCALVANRVYSTTNRIYLRRVREGSICTSNKNFNDFRSIVIGSQDILHSTKKYSDTKELSDSIIKKIFNTQFKQAVQIYDGCRNNKDFSDCCSKQKCIVDTYEQLKQLYVM